MRAEPNLSPSLTPDIHYLQHHKQTVEDWFETHVLGASASVVALHDRSNACNIPLCSHVLPDTARPTSTLLPVHATFSDALMLPPAQCTLLSVPCMQAQ